ncbi:TPA: DUF645 family protein [Vibrio cholerae]|nr:DUF645 family protein [Vibrio cholerae]HDZ9447928.1 DUF645 family protein [Vibrio cholerae]HDZ9493128.1 DUF645 family protein [Vibrio cholerae]HDZ9682944.1 DUF645 family protein [Vibrio cholerae]
MLQCCLTFSAVSLVFTKYCIIAVIWLSFVADS